MGRFDFDHFNGFAKGSLHKQLLGDFLHHDIFNERDMHSSAYYYIREYFRKRGRDEAYVRCDSTLAGVRPDIVIYERGKPIYVLEFKFFSKPDYINENSIATDLNKLADCMEAYKSVRWGFFYMIYDCDDTFTISRPSLRRDGFNKISVTSINARRTPETKYRRKWYDEWRADFDKLQHLQREHAKARRRSKRT